MLDKSHTFCAVTSAEERWAIIAFELEGLGAKLG